jgi:histidyl-tRNA synthetase
LATTSVQSARGTRDFLPADLRRREHVMRVVRGVYERYGFEPLETPAFENIETLLGKYGEEGNRLIFKILRRGEHEASGEADLGLRYDLTVPLARVIAQYQNELPRFFKRYQIQPVWRADRPARGRFREFYQCDIDTIGSSSPLVEAEQMAAVSEILGRLGFASFTFQLNHRRVLAGLLEAAGIPAAQHETALVALDKLDKIGVDGVARELEARGIGAEATRRLLKFFEETAGPGPEETLRQLEALLQGHDDALENLRAIVALVAETAAAGHVRLSLNLARGLSYYTGAIMELTVPELGVSLGAGGRYDNLIGMFLGRDIPACGFSLGFERILVVMTERGMFPAAAEGGAVDVVVTFMDEGSRPQALKLASGLRDRGRRVDVYPEASRKFDKALKYASGRGARVMGIFGENERAKGEASVRNLVTREQTSVARAEAVAFIDQMLTENSEPLNG